MTTHQPVLLQEVLTNLAIKPDGIYVDATFGRGGHAREILQRLNSNGKLIVIDKDPAAIMAAKQDPTFQDERVIIKQGPFTMLNPLAEQLNITGKIAGILFDLGVSSPQLDEAERGFSFLQAGPLDMRMDPTVGVSAAEWLQIVGEKELTQVLKDYGEERFARRIAAAIVRAGQQQPITTTTQLAAIVAEANPKWERFKNPATRTFQAIRIFINQELQELTNVLTQCLSLLTIGGRLLVISFHSLEDRIVKRFIEKETKGEFLPRYLPITQEQFCPRLRKVSAAIKASAAEIAVNVRARSAILRVAEKIA